MILGEDVKTKNQENSSSNDLRDLNEKNSREYFKILFEEKNSSEYFKTRFLENRSREKFKTKIFSFIQILQNKKKTMTIPNAIYFRKSLLKAQ